MPHRSREPASIRIGRYVIHPPIARGGMATVHPAHLVAEGGFTRLVAAKRLHPALAADPDVVSMFHDEARIASQIHHPGVVPVLDVVADGEEVVLVQEYVHGVPLGILLRRAVTQGEPIDIDLCIAAVAGLLTALHATHEARDEHGEPLNVIHRDVSAQNVMITVDGAVRLLDFGIAKARSSNHRTRVGVFKGKLVYMAPEHLRSEKVTRRADLYAVGVILWQLLVNRRFYSRPDEYAFVRAISYAPPPSMREALREARVPDARRIQIARLEPIVNRALASDPARRYATGAEMLEALLAVCRPAPAAKVAEWVKTAGAEHLASRRAALAASEEAARSHSRIIAARALDPSEAETLVVARPPAEGRLLTPPPVAASIAPPAPPTPSDASDEPISFRPTLLERLMPIVPWVGIAMSLLFIGILAGISAESSAPPPPAAAAAPPPAPVPPPPPASSPAPSESAAPAAPTPVEHPMPRPSAPRRR